jgi:phage/plasmid-like protein (TIGR03299 family)
MAHMIDQTTGRDAIAYIGTTPWHGLGQALTPDADIDTWTREAGLGYTVLESPVLYNSPAASDLQEWPNRKVLHRSDTGAPLAVVSDGYQVVQPGQVMDFFRDLVDNNGFRIETAGALSDGKRVWALASVGDAAPVLDRDLVKPYLLLGTSYDGTMATVAKFTAIRVVCNNTITAAVGGYSGGRAIRGEAETSTAYLKSAVRILHSERFDRDQVRAQLGIMVGGAWDAFLENTRRMTQLPMGTEEADLFLRDLLQPWHRSNNDISESRAFKRVMELFQGGAIGSNIDGVQGTRWGMLNAVTELVDHERGRSNNTRLESAWFGSGAQLKARAADLLSIEPEKIAA